MWNGICSPKYVVNIWPLFLASYRVCVCLTPDNWNENTASCMQISFTFQYETKQFQRLTWPHKITDRVIERERESVCDGKRWKNGILLTWNCLLSEFDWSNLQLVALWPQLIAFAAVDQNARDASESRSQLMQIKWIMIFVYYLWMYLSMWQTNQLRIQIFPQLIIQIGK